LKHFATFWFILSEDDRFMAWFLNQSRGHNINIFPMVHFWGLLKQVYRDLAGKAGQNPFVFIQTIKATKREITNGNLKLEK
jgi:hypothetical protein